MNDRRLAWISTICDIPIDNLSINPGGDVWAKNPETGMNFRIGYFHDNSFWRENPTSRKLRRHGIECKEGSVGPNSEPQYDIHITFTGYGNVGDISMQAIGMEAKSEPHWLADGRDMDEIQDYIRLALAIANRYATQGLDGHQRIADVLSKVVEEESE